MNITADNCVFRAGPPRGFHRHPGWPGQDGFYALGTRPEKVVAAVNAHEPQLAVYEALGCREIVEPRQPLMRKRLNEATNRSRPLPFPARRVACERTPTWLRSTRSAR